MADHVRDELIECAGRAGGVGELFGVASERLCRLVPFDAAVWLATDPATALPTAPIRAEALGQPSSLSRDECLRGWELEFLVEDVNLYRELARSDTPAGGLHAATRGCPARSARYRELLRPKGFDDELRAVLRAGGGTWASVSLLRRAGRPAFDPREIDLVASVSRPLAEAVREHARPRAEAPRRRSEAHGPGLMLFDPRRELRFVNDDGLAWLDELPADLDGETAFGVRLPVVVVGTLMRARAIAAGRDRGSARARLRSGAGRWLVCHASCLRGANGELGDTALVIEPAKAAEIAPIVVEAYDLSPREREITELISQGFGTAEIAGSLHLSVHTVRDYVKAVFEKAGVSSRGELVASLFGERYATRTASPTRTTPPARMSARRPPRCTSARSTGRAA